MRQTDGKHKTVKDLVRLFSLFNTVEIEERGVNETSKLLGMQPSKVSRLFGTLEDEGFLERNSETGKYRLGVEFFKLGIMYAHHSRLCKIVRPHIEQMAGELNLTASCAIFKNDTIIVIDRVQNVNIDLMSSPRLVLNLPIHSTAIGKVLLAYLPPEEQDRILQSIELTKLTPATIVDVALMKKNLQATRERGLAFDEGETRDYLNSIAAPIRNSRKEPVAALNLTAEVSKVPKEQLFRSADYLKERALFISRQLGYSPGM